MKNRIRKGDIIEFGEKTVTENGDIIVPVTHKRTIQTRGIIYGYHKPVTTYVNFSKLSCSFED